MSNYLKIGILVFFCNSLCAQQTIKVRRGDNRFVFYQQGAKTDTIVKNKSDNFYIHFPDSLKYQIRMDAANARFVKTNNDSLFRLMPISGMKYSHTLVDTSFTTLLEGNCPLSKKIEVRIVNTQTQKVILQSTFIAK